MSNVENIIITEKEFEKGKEWFEKAQNIRWIKSKADENTIAKEIEKYGSRIVVLGVENYENMLYEALSKVRRPALIARYGVGYDNIKTEICKSKNIFLVNTPNVLDRSVAEHAVALLLSLARNIPQVNKEFLKGDFPSRTGFELYGKSIGIAGFGNIGRKVASILGGGFSMPIYAYDIFPLESMSKKLNMEVEDFIRSFYIKKYFTEFY